MISPRSSDTHLAEMVATRKTTVRENRERNIYNRFKQVSEAWGKPDTDPTESLRSHSENCLYKSHNPAARKKRFIPWKNSLGGSPEIYTKYVFHVWWQILQESRLPRFQHHRIYRFGDASIPWNRMEKLAFRSIDPGGMAGPTVQLPCALLGWPTTSAWSNPE